MARSSTFEWTVPIQLLTYWRQHPVLKGMVAGYDIPELEREA